MAGSLTLKNDPNETTVVNIKDRSFSNRNYSIKSQNVTVFDLLVLTLSVFSIIVDLCTDLILVVQYSCQGLQAWAIGTFLLIFFPSVVVQFFSLRWHVVDKTASAVHWVLHFCMLGIIHRYIQLIKSAFAAYKSKNSSDIQKVFFDQSDLCILHLFESFLESAPQLVLQIYVIVKLQEWKFWTGLSALASLMSLAWSLAAYTKAQRRVRENKNVTTWPGLLLQAVWRTGMLTSRISTLVLAAYCFGNNIFIMLIIHWLGMTIWIIYQKTDFCETYWEEKIYNAVIGIVYCFCFFNLQEGQSRWRALAFYLVIIFQNLTCLTIFLTWFGEKTPKLAVFSFVAVIGGILFGSTGVLFYYRFFHPSGPIKLFSPQSSTTKVDPSPYYSSLTLRSLKRIRCENQGTCSRKTDEKLDSQLNVSNKTSASDSVVIIEENVLDDSDGDIKKLQNWINEPSDKTESRLNKNESIETETSAYKRRAICCSVELAKLLQSKAKPENENQQSINDESVSDILSAHDYENLCAVNIARETWGIRSWKGYSDIETELHDGSTVHDRRLDTLTSTASSDLSTSTFQKESEVMRPIDYIDVISEEPPQSESDTSLDYTLVQYSMNSISKVQCLGPLEPISEESEVSSSNESNYLKKESGSASTLVATIDEIRFNTPTQNRSDGIRNRLFLLNNIEPGIQRNIKKVTFASKLSAFEENESDHIIVENIRHNDVESREPELTVIKGEEKLAYEPKVQECSEVEVWNKENIPTVASTISHWNKIIDIHNTNLPQKVETSVLSEDTKKV